MRTPASSHDLRATSFEQPLSVSDHAKLAARSSKLLPKLLQKPYITLKEQLNIIHAVLQNRNPFHAHAECKSRNFRRIVIYEAIHIRIDHAAAQQFNPSAGLAVAARSAVTYALAIAENATDLHVGARLGKW